MEVIKRNGSSEPFNFAKVERVITFAIPDEAVANEFKESLTLQLKPRMTSKELQQALIQLAVEKTSAQKPEWDAVAAKLYLYDLYKEAGINRGYRKKQFGYGDFYKLLKFLTKAGLGDYVLKGYSKEQVEELGAYIKPERDDLLSYVGAKTLAERYCVRGYNGEVYELPQEAYMGVAMTLALVDPEETRVAHAKDYYDVMSLLCMTEATPTMSNARKPHNQLSSCFIGTADDSLESIFNVITNFSQVSKFGGGMGVYIGHVRASGSDIRGFANTSSGVIPWVRIFNDTAVAVNQLGMRAGAISITLDVWHKDIFSFLQVRTNNGDERMKAHDIFPSVSIPDIFMKQVKEKGKWWLFDPHEVRTKMGWNLEDCYDDGKENLFSYRYWQCVQNEDLSRIEVNAMDIMKAIIVSDTETGTPFIFFRDEVNRKNPNKHAGMIHASNLCHEIAQNTSSNGELETKVIKDKHTGDPIVVNMRKSGDFVVCNLASLILGRCHTEEQIAWVVPIMVRMLDNVISINNLPVPEATVTNQKYRAIGLGTMDYHHMLAMNGIVWESEEHLEFADKVFELINYYAIKGSMELAKERGAYPLFKGSDWDTGAYFEMRGYLDSPRWQELAKEVHEHGIRNGYIVAVAPNGSSSLYGNATQSIDPIYDKFYLDEKKGQVVPVIAPDLKKGFWYYKEAHKIDQSWSIRANAVRQRHIDQSQSFNLYITPETSAVELLKMYILAWETGCKTLYYTRSRSVELESCVACAA
ncbi:ribonucleoside-diphosphate reductase large subunit [Dabrowskivirus KKP3916]|uniref:Ribonucleoside-diphosphate reductase n=1 Tax=Alicyclobacillus phage KKP_3916 TaxID=3040651 RepID=A0AAT9V7K9_9CAUD|nr:ribonucleoside-diphosphate reductase large subunit [Alicyclobacillus phage KKP 3916]